jgi:hypothetical protein
MLLILPIHPRGLEKEVRIPPVFCGAEGPPTDGDWIGHKVMFFQHSKLRDEECALSLKLEYRMCMMR